MYLAETHLQKSIWWTETEAIHPLTAIVLLTHYVNNFHSQTVPKTITILSFYTDKLSINNNEE